MAAWDWLGWIGAAILALGALWVLARALLLDRSRGRRRCGKCWYDMSGVNGLRCPECGRAFKAERQLLRTRRHKRRAALGLLLLALAASAAHAPRLARNGWLASIPTPLLALILSVWDDQGDQLFAQMQGRLWTPAGAVGLSDWEQLLLARCCARKLREAATASGPAAAATFQSQSTVVIGDGIGSATTVTTISGPGSTWQYLSVLRALGPNARPALPELIASLEAGDGFARSEAAAVIGGMGEAARPAVPALAAMLEGASAADVRLALRVLGNLGPAGAAAAPALGRVIDASHTNTTILVRALSVAGAIGPDGRAALPAVLRAIESDADMSIRLVAVRAVGLIGHPAPEAVRTLAALVGHEDMAMRNAAARALERLGPPAASAAGELEHLLNDEHEFIREAAADALRAIRGR